MTEEKCLLNSIAANFDDDAARLVYADWLEEQGNTIRAEFVRTQCEHATQSCINNLDESLWERARKLENQLDRSIRNELRPFGIKKFEYRRGVLEYVSINCNTALPYLEALFEKYPTIRAAKITELHQVNKSYVDEFLEIPCLSQLRAIDFDSCRLGANEAVKIGNAKCFQNVETLRISGNPIHERGLRSILADGAFPNLVRLDISKSNIENPADCHALLNDTQFQKLEWLKCKEMYWNTQTRDQFLSAVTMPNLQLLHFGELPGHPDPNPHENLEQLLGSSAFANTKTLVLDYGFTNSETFEVMCNHANLSNLHYLKKAFYGDDLQALINAEAIWSELRGIHISSMQSKFEMEMVLNCPKFSGLDWIAWTGNAMTAQVESIQQEIEQKHDLKIVRWGFPLGRWEI